MQIQTRLLRFITRANWVLIGLASLGAFLMGAPRLASGILTGGCIVTVNFHMLYRTLKKALAPATLTRYPVVIVKYYIRFLVSGILLFILIMGDWVNPFGLIIGLSAVVVSIFLATLCELKHIMVKEAL